MVKFWAKSALRRVELVGLDVEDYVREGSGVGLLRVPSATLDRRGLRVVAGDVFGSSGATLPRALTTRSPWGRRVSAATVRAPGLSWLSELGLLGRASI